MKNKLDKIYIPIGAIILAALISLFVILTNHEEPVIEESEQPTAEIEYSDNQVPALITKSEDIEDVETGQGAIGSEVEIKNYDGSGIPTVESVENNTPVVEVENDECKEGEECGRGATYPKLNIATPQDFANDTLGKCLDLDGHYGAQCWDSMDAFFLNYVNRALSTCGSGAAKGTIADKCWQKNAGKDFTMIWDKAKIQAGDIVVFSTGQWGHIGMAMGKYNNGYITLLGQNQGGKACPNGGAAGNIINISTRDFIGAFRPNIYIKPEPKPEPKPTPAPVINKCKKRNVVKGDTLGKIMKECKGKITWGQAMNDYAKHWVSTKIKPNQTVYYGWTHGTGYGLYAGDTIEYR